MFVDFNKVFHNRKQTQISIPPALVSYLNKELPTGIKYVLDSGGNCVVASEGETCTVGGYSFKLTEEQKKVLGKNFSKEDVFKYFYNSQKPIPLILKKEGFITLNGEEFPVEKLSFNPLNPIEYVKGTACLVPPAFPLPFNIEVGCKQYSRILNVSRIPNESVNVAVFESEKEKPLYIKYWLDEKNEKFNIDISFNLKYAKNARDIVEATSIYNAYIENEGYLCGKPLVGALIEEDAKSFEKNSISFWNKVLKIEEYLGVSFNPQQENVDFEMICIVEQLFQNLINKVPIIDEEVIESISGNWNFSTEKNVMDGSIGKPIYFEYEATSKIELFGTEIELPALLGIFNAILYEYEVKEDKQTIFLKDESLEKKRYTVIMCFKTEEELNNFKNREHEQRIKRFRNAKRPQEYLEG